MCEVKGAVVRNRARSWFAIIVALGLIWLAVPAQGQETGGISGVLTDSSNGAPIAGQTVVAEGPSGGGSSVTAADGSYTISGLGGGSFAVGTGN